MLMGCYSFQGLREARAVAPGSALSGGLEWEPQGDVCEGGRAPVCARSEAARGFFPEACSPRGGRFPLWSRAGAAGRGRTHSTPHPTLEPRRLMGMCGAPPRCQPGAPHTLLNSGPGCSVAGSGGLVPVSRGPRTRGHHTWDWPVNASQAAWPKQLPFGGPPLHLSQQDCQRKVWSFEVYIENSVSGEGVRGKGDVCLRFLWLLPLWALLRDIFVLPAEPSGSS